MSQPAPEFDLTGLNPVRPSDYAENGYPHELFTWLRAHSPVHRWEQERGIPYWSITKHEDITAIGKRPEIFVNGPRLTISDEPEVDHGFPPTLIQLDPPKHGTYRQLISKRFTPRALERFHADIDEIGKEIVEKLLDKGEGECDFVSEVSAPLPIAVIAWMLGLPREDWNLLFDWTNRIIGAADPDFSVEGKTSGDAAVETMTELFMYFSKLVEEKKKSPGDDLVSLFTQMRVDGEPLPPMDVLAWCLIIVIAGNETTRNATTGGMLALIEHPGEIRKLQQNPGLLASSIEEMVRWTTPIIHFGRTATQDYELRGTQIKAGDALALFYPSANRDEEIFEDPFEFRIDRSPNRHLGFGVGEHFCLGAHLARLEMEVAFKYLVPHIEEIELAGDVDRLYSALVGGVKRLPIRYKLK